MYMMTTHSLHGTFIMLMYQIHLCFAVITAESYYPEMSLSLNYEESAIKESKVRRVIVVCRPCNTKQVVYNSAAFHVTSAVEPLVTP